MRRIASAFVAPVAALLVNTPVQLRAQQQDVVLQLGGFVWEGTAGLANLQLHPAQRQVTVAVGLVNVATVNGRRASTASFPSGEITAWVLLDDGSALRHLSTYPLPGRPAPGAGNAGGGASYAFLSFDAPANMLSAPAIVVRVRSDLYVFPVGRGSPGTTPRSVPSAVQAIRPGTHRIPGVQDVRWLTEAGRCFVHIVHAPAPASSATAPALVWLLKNDGTVVAQEFPRGGVTITMGAGPTRQDTFLYDCAVQPEALAIVAKLGDGFMIEPIPH
jgi:hypothetical protein